MGRDDDGAAGERTRASVSTGPSTRPRRAADGWRPTAGIAGRGRRRSRASVTLLAMPALALACGGDPTGGTGAVRVVSAPAGDTVQAALAQPLVVQVRAPSGTLVVFRSSAVPTQRGAPLRNVYFSRTADFASIRGQDTVAIEAAGRASIYLRLGFMATEAVVTTVVPSLGDSVQVRIAVRPGAPQRLIALPADTALYVGRGYALRASLVDRFDNVLPTPQLTFTTDSAAVTVTDGGAVTGHVIGRVPVIVRTGSHVDTAWASVVPEGRIAAVRYSAGGGEPTSVVLVNLDGSARRSFALHPLDVPRPAWHPDGSYLVASIRPPGSAPDGVARLAALDTATGTWRPIPGTGEEMGDGYAEFSQDGMWIYLANSSTNPYRSTFGSAVHRVRADGSGSPELVGYDHESSTSFDHPSLSPDGTRVAMTVDGSSGWHTLIVSVAPPLGPPPPWFGLVRELPTGAHPRWSPTSDDVLMFGTEGMWLMPAGTRSVGDRRYLARAWAGVAHVTGGFQGASWSPDGRWVVARAQAGLILVEVATDRVLPLAIGNGLSDPTWRPR